MIQHVHTVFNIIQCTSTNIQYMYIHVCTCTLIFIFFTYYYSGAWLSPSSPRGEGQANERLYSGWREDRADVSTDGN